MLTLRVTKVIAGLVLVSVVHTTIHFVRGQDDRHAQTVQEAADSYPLFTGLGSFDRLVTTSTESAQRYFTQGLAFLYAFNHDEAQRSFAHATKKDPNCAMAWWGIAMANGPHINRPAVTEQQAETAVKALAAARKIIESGAGSGGGPTASTVSPIEIALIDAAEKRYASPQPEDRKPLDEAFANAMREVWKTFNSDPDVGSIFAESMMDLRPWDLWQADGMPQPGTEEVVQTLERVLELAPNHPLALHLYIHAVEASPHAEKAREEADRLRDLQPGLGHLVHMPSHIDIRLGQWAPSIVANEKAIAADEAYREISPRQDFYRIYMAHNRHMLVYSAMMIGRSQLALEKINEMAAGMPEEWIKENVLMADGFAAQPLEVLVRFGKWDEILHAPEPPEYLPVSRALWRKSRAIAFATRGDLQNACREQEAFAVSLAAVPAEGIVGNNTAADVLKIAELLMQGEICYRQGHVEAGLAKLREAIPLEDKLKYNEPPDWMNPVRHALGATLLQESRGAEAEAVFRKDLAIHPNNGWALFGLARSLELQGRTDEAAKVRAEFATIWRDADIQIQSPCLCQPGN